MNGTIVSRALRGLLILGAALALGSAGCVDPGDESESEGDDDVAAVDQQLEAVDGEDGEEGEDADDVELPGSPGGDATRGDDRKGPEPQPWRTATGPSPDPGPDPLQHTASSTPSNNNNK